MEKSESSSDNQTRPWQSYHTVYTNAKAGMEGVDKEKVQRIVYEMSKGSKYFENEERKEAQMRQKIEHMRARCAKLTSADLSNYQKVVDKRILELEATRDLSRVWLHVDMDAFYAAVETLSNPSLKSKPMAVGSMSMISTANYEARKFGVRAAMPGFIACKLCPYLIFVPTDFTKYTYYSDLTRKVFRNYDPNFLAASLDEAYLDITEVCREKGISGEEITEELRSAVYAETGLTCSAGVAPNRLLAKVCSDINKPNGQFVLPNDRIAVMTFVSSLPIRKIGGIGKVTESILKDALGINTCEQLRHKGCLLYALFSQSTADFFLSVGLGLGKTDTPQVTLRKSISNERTFEVTEDETLLYQKLADIVEILSADMRKQGLSARTLTLKLKTASFEIRTRAVTLQKYICSSEDILKYASKLLKAELPVSLRLIGLRMSQFHEGKGYDPDPSQKAITSFIIQETSSRKNPDGRNFLDSDGCENSLRNDKDTSLSPDTHETSQDQIMNEIECEDVLHLNDNDANEVDRDQEPLNNENAKVGNTVDSAWDIPIPRPEEKEGSQVLEADSLLRKHVEIRLDRRNAESDTREIEAVSSSNQTEPLFWVDGYKCALCGIELPPSFIEERQEHSDLHLAERLQKEESATGSTPVSRRRLVEKANRSKSKKQKSSPKDSKHIPIDIYFVKSNQNF